MTNPTDISDDSAPGSHSVLRLSPQSHPNRRLQQFRQIYPTKNGGTTSEAASESRVHIQRGLQPQPGIL